MKRQSVEVWQDEKHYFKENNTSPKTKNIQISRPYEVRRSGQVSTFVVCAVFLLSFQAVMLLTKTAINHHSFFNPVRGEWMDLRNSKVIELRNFYVTTVWKLLSNVFIISGKNTSCGTDFRYFQIK